MVFRSKAPLRIGLAGGGTDDRTRRGAQDGTGSGRVRGRIVGVGHRAAAHHQRAAVEVQHAGRAIGEQQAVRHDEAGVEHVGAAPDVQRADAAA